MRQWLSTAASLMCEPVTCSTNRYGPLPTGFCANTSSPLASMYFLGRIMPSVESERDRYVGMISVGSLVTITSRSDAGVSMSPMSVRSEEHTSELQSRLHLVCRLLLEKKKNASSPHHPHRRIRD